MLSTSLGVYAGLEGCQYSVFRLYLIEKMKNTLLGISLIHGQFRALALVRDQVQGAWESPTAVKTPEEIKVAMQEAIQATRYPGDKVCFLMEDSDLVHRFLQVPAMKIQDLRKYLANAADQESTVDGHKTIRFRTTHSVRGNLRILLDIWPTRFIDDVVEVCKQLNVTPVQMVPLGATFLEQIRSLPVEPHDVVLLVTIMEGKLVFVVANGDGTPLFERFLSPTRKGINEVERIGHEITRTMLYVNQQFAVSVSQIWVIGGSGETTAEHIQTYVDFPIQTGPLTPDHSYWIWVSMSLPLNNPFNFIAKEIRQAPFRKGLMKFTAALVASFLIVGVGTTSLLQGLLVSEQERVTALASQTTNLAGEKHQWETRLAELRTQEQWAKQVNDQRQLPLAGWMLGYLGTILPQDIILEKFTIHHKTPQWELQLTGNVPGDLVLGSQLLAALEQQLVEGPFHVRLTEDWRQSWLQQTSTTRSGTATDQRHQFSMIGHIQ